jgi:hypothetical protein
MYDQCQLILDGAVQPFDLAVGLGMVAHREDMLDAQTLQVGIEDAPLVAVAVIAEQLDPLTARGTWSIPVLATASAINSCTASPLALRSHRKTMGKRLWLSTTPPITCLPQPVSTSSVRSVCHSSFTRVVLH